MLRDGAQNASYQYDKNGNRIVSKDRAGESKATYDTQDRLVRYGGASYRYTVHGELANKAGGGNNTSYDYDARGNLRSVTLPAGPKIEYVIDGVNRRIGKKLNGKLVQGFLYGDQLKPVAELDGRNNVVSTFAYGTRANVPEYVEKSDGIYRIITDHLGSPRLVINVESGALAQRMDYDAFGNVLQDTNPGFQPFGFAGGIYDHHTKLTRFGARDYDAATGRWTGKDPLRFAAAETNLYAYAYNDPINFVDVNGLAVWENIKTGAEIGDQVGKSSGDFRYWSEGGQTRGSGGGFHYTGTGFAAAPDRSGGVRFEGNAGVEGPIGPGTFHFDVNVSGSSGPEGTSGEYGARSEYTVPVGYVFDFRGEAWTRGDFSGEGRWGGGASFGFGKGKTACRVGVGASGDFSGNASVETVIQLPF